MKRKGRRERKNENENEKEKEYEQKEQRVNHGLKHCSVQHDMLDEETDQQRGATKKKEGIYSAKKNIQKI